MQDTTLDLELARRAAGGDESAWQRIYDSTCDRLFSLLCYQVGDRDEALDLLQETYLRAFENLQKYRGDAPLSAWLRTIGVRAAIGWKRSLMRRLKRAARMRQEMEVEMSTRTAGQSAQVRGNGGDYASLVAGSPAPVSQTRIEWETALQRLSPNQRAALLLKEWEGWSFAEISAALGCKESTVRVHHAKARERLRVALTEDTACVATKTLEGQKP